MSAAVVPSQGGEVAAMQVLHKGAWVETLHRALDYAPDPDEWGGHAPLQWPAVGRNSVQEQLDAKQDIAMGSWLHEGKRFPIPILGFARFMEFVVADSGASDERAWVECRASACDYSRQYYPFEFELRYTHIMDGQSLRSRCIVRNLETTRPLPFSIGNHITFHLPFTTKGSFEECVIVSPTTSHLDLDANDLLSGRELPKDLRRGGMLADRELWNMV